MDASPATIFPFLTDPAQHVRWMGTEAELDPRVGGAYRVLVQGKHPGVGDFVEVVPDRKVVFTFGWDEPDHPIPARSTEVEITLIPDGDKTRVRLVHRSLPTTQWAITPRVGTTTSIDWPSSPPAVSSGPTPPVTPAEHAARGLCPETCASISPSHRTMARGAESASFANSGSPAPGWRR